MSSTIQGAGKRRAGIAAAFFVLIDLSHQPTGDLMTWWTKADGTPDVCHTIQSTQLGCSMIG
jgi:hypothetical protein